MKKSKSAYTFIELLCALFILTVGILGLTNLQIASINSNKANYLKTKALFFAEKYIEEIKLLPFDEAEEQAEEIKKGIFLISWDLIEKTSNYKLFNLYVKWKIKNKEKMISFLFLKEK